MKINAKGTNMKLTSDIKDYLFKKIESLQKFLSKTDETILFDVEIGKISKHHKNGDVFRTEINLRIAGKNLRAESEMDDIFASIDMAKDEMARELKTNKEKKVSLLKKGGAKIKNLVKGVSDK
jgi:ribosomal subunit interface protein